MEQFSAKEKDKVLNQINLSSIIRLRELDGNIDYNRLIINELDNDKYICVIRMGNSEMDNIRLTPSGESFKNIGGYSRMAKKERKEKYKRRLKNAIKWILGFFTAILIFAISRIILL